jgi:hypothetical protein
MVGICSRPFHAARGNLRSVSGNCTREQAFFTLILHGRARFPPLSRRPRKFTAGFRKLHPRTSLFHPDSPWSGSVPIPFTSPAEISAGFRKLHPRTSLFHPDSPWSGSVPVPFTSPAEIYGRFQETAPANKPFSPPKLSKNTIRKGKHR